MQVTVSVGTVNGCLVGMKWVRMPIIEEELAFDPTQKSDFLGDAGNRANSLPATSLQGGERPC